MVFGRNYDWVTETGMVNTNLRGMLKSAFEIEKGKTIQWVSKYGSITSKRIRSASEAGREIIPNHNPRQVEQGIFENNKWKVMRHLNGDQTHQGRHVSIPIGNTQIQKVTLYNYE